MALGARRSAIRTSSRSTSPRSCGRSRASSIASRAPSSSCSCSRSPAACWCCRRRSRRRRTSASSTRRSCARSARRSGSCRARRRPSSCCSGALAGLLGAAGATAIGYALAEHVFNIRVHRQCARVAVRHRRRRGRRHARRLARHAVDGERAAAHGTAPTRLIRPVVRKDCIKLQSRGTMCSPHEYDRRKFLGGACDDHAPRSARHRDRRAVARRQPHVDVVLGRHRPAAGRRRCDRSLSRSRPAHRGAERRDGAAARRRRVARLPAAVARRTARRAGSAVHAAGDGDRADGADRRRSSRR